jgi:hypothetical protein
MRPEGHPPPPIEGGLTHGERVRLRAAVLRAGAALGWPPCAVIACGEALTGVPWRRWGCAELEAALDEFLELLGVVQERARRPAGAGATPKGPVGGRRAARA